MKNKLLLTEIYNNLTNPTKNMIVIVDVMELVRLRRN